MARLYGALCRALTPGAVEVCTVRADPADGPDPFLPEASPFPIQRMDIPFARVGRLPNVIRWGRWLRRRLRAGGIDVLQVGNIRPAGYLARWCRDRGGPPYVIYVHGLDLLKEERKTRRSRWRYRAGRWVLGGAAAIIANSRDTADRARRLLHHLQLDDHAVCVIHPGTDPEQFQPGAKEEAWRRRLDLGDAPVVLTVGRLVPRKGMDTVMQALPTLLEQHPDIVYLIAGTGPDRARLEGLANALRVNPYVRFLGHVAEPELPSLYAAADIFALVSREEPNGADVEGFGIVFCEAGAAAIPVVGGRSGGVPDAVREGETGLLVDAASSAAVAAALGRLLDDSALRARLGQGGRRAVEEYYNWERMAREVEGLLGRVVEGKVPA